MGKDTINSAMLQPVVSAMPPTVGCTLSRNDRVMPRDIVPTDEEGVELIGSMVAYAGTFSLGDGVVVHHIDTSWNQAWTGTDQIRHFVLEGDTLTITTAPYKSYLDGTLGRSILVWTKIRSTC